MVIFFLLFLKERCEVFYILGSFRKMEEKLVLVYFRDVRKFWNMKVKFGIFLFFEMDF